MTTTTQIDKTGQGFDHDGHDQKGRDRVTSVQPLSLDARMRAKLACSQFGLRKRLEKEPPVPMVDRRHRANIRDIGGYGVMNHPTLDRCSGPSEPPGTHPTRHDSWRRHVVIEVR
jgi:hypothetical protein